MASCWADFGSIPLVTLDSGDSCDFSDSGDSGAVVILLVAVYSDSSSNE